MRLLLITSLLILTLFLATSQFAVASPQDRMNAALTGEEKLERAKTYAVAVVSACDLEAQERQKVIEKLNLSLARAGDGFQPNDYGDFHWFEFPVSAGANFTHSQLKPFLDDHRKLADQVKSLISSKDDALKKAMASWFVACVDAHLVLEHRQREQLAELVVDRCFADSSLRLISVSDTTSIGIERILITDRLPNEKIGEVLGSQRQQLWERMFNGLDQPEPTVIDHNDSDAEWNRMIVAGAKKSHSKAMEEMKLQLSLQSKFLKQPEEKYVDLQKEMTVAMNEVSRAYTKRLLDGFEKMSHVPDSTSTIQHPTFSSWYWAQPAYREALKNNLTENELNQLKSWRKGRKDFIENSTVELIVATIDTELVLSKEQRIEFAKAVKASLPHDRHLNIADDFREFRLVAETIRNISDQSLPELSQSQANSWKCFRRQMKSSGQTIAVCLGQPTVCQVWTGPPVRKARTSEQK